MTGRTIGKYRIGDQIGRGGMGTVYRAIDETLHREVAIKAIHAELLTPESVERFRAEAITLARLTHPRIATIHELTPDGQTLLMVMEYIPGETCEKLIARAGPVPVSRAVVLCDQVLDALQHAHAAGIVHRDLKPANVMVTGFGDVKVMDFGIARVAGSQHLTLDGYVMGTPAYMSPEQVRGAEVDPRMDLYAVSVILYQLLTRRLPFEADSPLSVMQAKLSGLPTPPRQYRVDLPEWIDAVLKRGLANAPLERFQTAAEYRRALEAGSSGGFAAAAWADDDVPTIPQTPSPSGVRASGPRFAALPDSVAVPTPSSRAEQTVTLRTPHLAAVGALLTLLVIAVGVLAYATLRRPAPAFVPLPTVATQAVPAPPGEKQAPPPAPSTSAVHRAVPAPTPAPAPRTSTPIKSAQAVAVESAPAPAAPPAVPSASAESFNVGVMVPNEQHEPREFPSQITFEPDTVVVRGRINNVVRLTLAYRSIAIARYSHGRGSGRQGAAAGASQRFNGRGALSGPVQHWLLLQWPAGSLMMHVAPRNIDALLAAIESHTSIKVERPTETMK